MMKKTGLVLELGLRLVLGGVFIYASWGKIIHTHDFAEVIANYQIVPAVAVNSMALLLPWIELICGICLIIGWQKRGAIFIVGSLLLVFMAALGHAWYRGVDIGCGCFSTNQQATSNLLMDLLRDGVLMLMIIGLWIRVRISSPKFIVAC